MPEYVSDKALDYYGLPLCINWLHCSKGVLQDYWEWQCIETLLKVNVFISLKFFLAFHWLEAHPVFLDFVIVLSCKCLVALPTFYRNEWNGRIIWQRGFVCRFAETWCCILADRSSFKTYWNSLWPKFAIYPSSWTGVCTWLWNWRHAWWKWESYWRR